jgi:hypothetical protein
MTGKETGPAPVRWLHAISAVDHAGGGLAVDRTSAGKVPCDDSFRGQAIARSIAAEGVKAIADGVGGHDDSETTDRRDIPRPGQGRPRRRRGARPCGVLPAAAEVADAAPTTALRTRAVVLREGAALPRLSESSDVVAVRLIEIRDRFGHGAAPPRWPAAFRWRAASVAVRSAPGSWAARAHNPLMAVKMSHA